MDIHLYKYKFTLVLWLVLKFKMAPPMFLIYINTDDCEDKTCLDEQHLCYDIAGKCMCANGYKMDGDKCVGK